MSEQLRESLSAAMDDEADAFELRRVLDEAKHNNDLREQWHRFHLLRDLLREDVKNYHPKLRSAIWEDLHQAVDDAETVAPLVLAEEVVAGVRQHSFWRGRITAVVVAVAVAVFVIINGDVFDVVQTSVDYAGVEQPSTRVTPVPVMYEQATALDQRRQNGLMLHHFQQRAMNQASVASFVKVATFRSVPSRAAGKSIAPSTARTTAQMNGEEPSSP